MITRIKATNYRCFKDLDFQPNAEVNILVGDNEAGKSTLLEVISLVVSGRVRGRWANDDLNPYWFNQNVVAEFFEARRNGQSPDLPLIDLEIFFTEDTPSAERLCGLHNSEQIDCPGLRLKVVPDPERSVELATYLAQDDLPELIPTDLLVAEWRCFEGSLITRQPRGLGIATVSAGNSSSSSGIDYKMRQLLRDFVTPAESAKIALEHRKAKGALTSGVLRDVNRRIHDDGNSFGVGLQMDQSANANWDVAVTPHIEETPFSFLGQGRQVSTKIALAMGRSAANTRFVLVEEPENHLSHTQLTQMIDIIKANAAGRQLFITTHSSFVLNRLGFDMLHLMHDARIVPLNSDVFSEDTIAYFQKQSGYDTLRLAIASKVVVVEGPSDEMVFNLAYKRIKGAEPRDRGIDVVALGTRGKRALELASALGKKIAVLRDNDGKSPAHWQSQAGSLLLAGARELFVGAEGCGRTLEPQIISANGEEKLRTIFGMGADEDVEAHMLSDKTEAAWRIANTPETLEWPSYITEAIEFIDAG
ncbi:ATP-dependent nuclease [Brevibacterium sp. CSND-B09]|uniref:ATP-dependent nuclease n=1 Tax=Brevibacterium sp. CSND-B09 TaxID=3462571 RepID=UPI00406A8AAB